MSKRILSELHNGDEVRDLLNSLTGLILEVATKGTSRADDHHFNDALHPDVHNELSDAVTKAVELVVDNWDIEL